jgi:hypothetical protein
VGTIVHIFTVYIAPMFILCVTSYNIGWRMGFKYRSKLGGSRPSKYDIPTNELSDDAILQAIYESNKR